MTPDELSRCPLCAAENGCGLAAGESTCWCMTAAIPRDVLERVPADAQRRQCICARCARAGTAEPSDEPVAT
jgi:hypothetical protein